MGYHGTPYLHILYSSCVWKLGGTPLKNWVSPMSSGCRWFRTQRTPANSKQRPSPPKHKREPFLRHFAKIDVQQTLWISPCQFHQLLKDGERSPVLFFGRRLFNGRWVRITEADATAGTALFGEARLPMQGRPVGRQQAPPEFRVAGRRSLPLRACWGRGSSSQGVWTRGTVVVIHEH